MAVGNRTSRNNALAGLFLLLALALGLLAVVVMADIRERMRPTNDYIVRFPLDVGAGGLEPGSSVTVGNQPAGRVTGWEFSRDPERDEPVIDVRVRVRADIGIGADAHALLVVPLLGTTSSINIPRLGDASPDNLLACGGVIEGRMSTPAFMAQAGWGPDQAEQMQDLLRSASEVGERLNRLTARVEDEFDPMVEDVRAAIEDVRAIVADARSRWPEWGDSADRIMARLDEAAASLPGITAEAREGVEEARAVVASVQSMIDDNRPRIDSAIINIDELMEKASGEGYDAVLAVIERASEGVDQFAEAADHVNTLIKQQSPELRTIVANARLASDQLKLTTTEVRRAPWKLLSKPTGRRELENEVLYDSVRQYAIAVSNLRATAASLESVALADGEPTELDRRTIDMLVRNLEEAFQRYEEAERLFMERFVGSP